jgi:hypothetical protein
MTIPPSSAPLATWNAYVESGDTREDRAARLATVPDNLRHMVMAHVACYFKVRTAKARAKR